MTREQAGRVLGMLVVVAGVLGLPYAMLAFGMWELNPALWGGTARAVALLFAVILSVAYGASRLPATPPEPPVDSVLR